MKYYDKYEASDITDLKYQDMDFDTLGDLVRCAYYTKDSRWIEDAVSFCRQMEAELKMYRDRSRILQEELAKFPVEFA